MRIKQIVSNSAIFILLIIGACLATFHTTTASAAVVMFSKNGLYDLRLTEAESQQIDIGYKLDIRPYNVEALYDAEVLQIKGDLIQIRMIDGPRTLRPGTLLFIKPLVKKTWYNRSMLRRSSSLNTSLYGGGLITSQEILAGEFGLAFVLNSTFDLEGSGFVGTAQKTFVYGAGARLKYFPIERFYGSLGGRYLKLEQDNPKQPKSAANIPPLEWPTFHDETKIVAEASIGMRLDSVSNLKIGKGFTIIIEFGGLFPILTLYDSIPEVTVLEPDLITGMQISMYLKIGGGYFF
jgi:hypothetical protein